MYVYIRTEFAPYYNWTVGFYRSNGEWEPESDHSTPEAAAERIAYLNGERAQDHEEGPYNRLAEAMIRVHKTS